MRFFNLDCHISVIADIHHIFAALGHTVDSWSLSGHNWVFGRSSSRVEIINEHTWRDLCPDMCNAFYNRYKDDLASYDAFIVTYPPAFAWAFEKWHKPIIIVAPIRYETPFSGHPLLWAWFNHYLRCGFDYGTIIPIANNIYDAQYAERFTQHRWRHIPSLCEYTGVQWQGNRPEYILHSRQTMNVPGTVHRSEVLPIGYQWKDLMAFRGAVYWPYNASTMTIFENYAQGVPMFFPSFQFAKQMREKDQNSIFTELSWNQICGLPNYSLLGEREADPNAYDRPDFMMEWAKLSDFYQAHMPKIQYFDSFEELPDRLATFKAKDVSEQMLNDFPAHKESVYKAWSEVINHVKNVKGRI